MFSSADFIDAADPLYAALIPELVDMNDNSVGIQHQSVDGSVRATFAPLQPEEFNGLHRSSAHRWPTAGVERCLQHTDGIREAPKIVWLGLTRVRHVNNAIRDVLEVIDEPLARLISRRTGHSRSSILSSTTDTRRTTLTRLTGSGGESGEIDSPIAGAVPPWSW